MCISHIFHLYISYHSSSSIYVDLIAPVANVICYNTTSTINKYFLSYLITNSINMKYLFTQDVRGTGPVQKFHKKVVDLRLLADRRLGVAAGQSLCVAGVRGGGER